MHRSRLPLIALVTICLLGSPALALARDIFVSTTGKDSNSGSSPEQALRTIAAASDKAAAGDTIHLLPGRYNEAIKPTRSGSSGKPIVYRSYGPTPAILTHSSKNGLEEAISIHGRSYIVVDGIDVDGVKPGPNASVKYFVRVKDSQNVTVRGGSFKYANGYFGVLIDGTSKHVILEDNTIDFVGRYDNGADKNSDDGDLVTVAKTTSHVLIQRNVMRHGPHNVLSVGGRYCVVQDNYLDNSYRDVLGGDTGGRVGAFWGQDGVFQRNYVTGSGASSDSNTNSLLKVEGTNNIVRMNVFAYGHFVGILTESGSWSPTSILGRIYNNTFYRLGSGAWLMRFYDGGKDIGRYVFANNLIIDSRMKPPSSPTDVDLSFNVAALGKGPTAESRIFNNIIHPANGKAPVVLLSDAGGTMSLDQVHSRHAQLFSGNLISRTQFASASPAKVADFDLASGSEAIDKGAFLTRVVGSGESNQIKVADSRFFTNGYGVIPGDTIQLEGSTVRARVTSVDHSSGTLKLDTAIAFRDGQGIALAYEGSAPDIGAMEYGKGGSGLPSAPANLRIE